MNCELVVPDEYTSAIVQAKQKVLLLRKYREDLVLPTGVFIHCRWIPRVHVLRF